jgi:membrane peptidoglycan carboxypeptidase
VGVRATPGDHRQRPDTRTGAYRGSGTGPDHAGFPTGAPRSSRQPAGYGPVSQGPVGQGRTGHGQRSYRQDAPAGGYGAPSGLDREDGGWPARDAPSPRGGQPASGTPRAGQRGGSGGLFLGGGTGEDGGPRAPLRPTGAVVLRLALLSALAGVALAGLAVPFLGGLGLFAKSSADHFVNLPANLTTPPLAQNTRILAKDGSTVAVLHGVQDRVVAPLAQIPPIMQTAIIDIEDSRFYSHGGVDVRGMLRAAVHDSSATGSQQGGSTLTQQYVKNVLLQSASTAQQRAAATGDSLTRKLQEARYAVAIEQKYSKKEILERYLNIAYFGDGAYGVGTAAQHYFGRPVTALTLPQAALLAGLVQSPSDYDPFTDPAAAKARRDVVLDRMAQLGHITTAQASAAKASPLGVMKTRPVAAPDSCQTSSAPFFCDYIRTALLNDPALGATAQERSNKVYEGGLVIHTTLDPKVQKAAQNAVNATISPASPVSATEVVVEPGTGNVLAMAVNRTYGTNAARNQTTVTLPTSATFQPGSTFKAFTLTTALQQGYGLSTAFYSPACYVSPLYNLSVNSGRVAGGTCANGFSNADPAEAGVYNLSQATWNSVNTFYIQLEEKVGVLSVAHMAVALGIPAAYLSQVGTNDGSLTIGSTVVTPLDMANAYATLANHGTRCDVRPIASATDASGQPVDIASRSDGTRISATNAKPSGRAVVIGGTPSCTPVISAGIADTATSVLTGVIKTGTGFPNATVVGRPAAGKTGTTDGFRSAWFVGYTPQMSAAVAVGDPRGPENHRLVNIVANGRSWPQVFGGDLPAIAWGRSMQAALAPYPVIPLAGADPVVAQGTKGGLLSKPPAAAKKGAGKKGRKGGGIAGGITIPGIN